MVGGEAPQEKMRGWGQTAHPQKLSDLTTDREIRATHNLVEQGKRGSVGGGSAKGEGIAEEEDGRNSGETESPEEWRRKRNLRSGLPLSWK